MTEGFDESKNDPHLLQLVLSLETAAMQQMGKLQNPITKKVERNLDQARFSIDVLEMLQDKTKNNLTENEQKFLEHTLYELRMNYLDEVKKDQQKKEEKDSTRKEEGKEQEGAEKKAGAAEQKPEDEDSAKQEKGKAQPGSDEAKEKED